MTTAADLLLTCESCAAALNAALTRLYKDAASDVADVLRAALLDTWTAAQRRALDAAIAELTTLAPGPLTEADVASIIAGLEGELGVTYAVSVAAPVATANLTAYSDGRAGVTGALEFGFNVPDSRAIGILEEHTLHFVRESYQRSWGPLVQASGQKVLEQGLTREQAAKVFRLNLETVLDPAKSPRTELYWSNFSNNVVTRSRVFGATQGFTDGGITTYRITAVLDDRTSDICKGMDGRTFQVSRAVELVDAYLAADTPEAAIELVKWPKPANVAADIPTADLPLGLALPPYHFGCRTDVVAVA